MDFGWIDKTAMARTGPVIARSKNIYLVFVQRQKDVVSILPWLYISKSLVSFGFPCYFVGSYPTKVFLSKAIYYPDLWTARWYKVFNFNLIDETLHPSPVTSTHNFLTVIFNFKFNLQIVCYLPCSPSNLWYDLSSERPSKEPISKVCIDQSS